MSGLDDFREANPEYNDIGDVELAGKLHSKFYADVPPEQYFTKLGLTQKPEAEGVGIGTQTLYDMARDDDQKRQVLAKEYGDENVLKLPSGEHAAIKDGKLYSPTAGSFLKRGAAKIAAEAAPIIGATVGGLVGGAAAAPETAGAGIPVGAYAGAGLGLAGGEAFNDSVLALAGVHTGTPGEIAKRTGEHIVEGAAGQAGGEIIGKAIGGIKGAAESVPGLAKSVKDKVSPTAAAATRYFFGANPENQEIAKGLAEQGVPVHPSSWLDQAPIMRFVMSWAKKYGYDPVGKAAEPYYQSGAQKVLGDLGVAGDDAASLTRATSKPSMARAGEAVQRSANAVLEEKDALLGRQLLEAQQSIEAEGRGAGTAHEAKLAALQSSLKADQDAASAVVKETTDKALATAKNLSETWKKNPAVVSAQSVMEATGKLVQASRKAITDRAQGYYGATSEIAGDAKINMSSAIEPAKALMAQLPEDLQKNFPEFVRMLSKLDEGGDPNWSFGEAHYFRSLLRDVPNWSSLTTTMREGVYKKFSGIVDAAIHSPENDEPIKRAAKALDDADAFYRDNMKQFKSSVLQGVVNNLKDGLPSDPGKLARMVFMADESATAAKVRDIVGPEVWQSIAAADAQNLVRDATDGVTGKLNAKAFMEQVSDRINKGLFQYGYPKELETPLRDLATKFAQQDGKLEIPLGPNDSFGTVLKRIKDTTAQIDADVKIDPIGAMARELATMKTESTALRNEIASGKTHQFMSELTDNSMTAEKAATRILSDDTLLERANTVFGQDSEAMTLLRQNFAKKMLTQSVEDAAGMAKWLRDNMSDKAQSILFPGVARGNLQTLAKNMEFIMGPQSGIGESLSAASAVTHPAGLLPSALHTFKKLPAAVLRLPTSYALGKAAKLISSPQFVNWAAQGLASDNPETRVMTKLLIRQAVAAGGRTGGAEGAAAVAASVGDHEQAQPAAPPPTGSWREKYQQRYAQ